MVQDEAEADHILEWLSESIKAAWEGREHIEPSFEAAEPPRILEILKLLPRTNCRACGQPTCMVFAAQVGQGVQGPGGCPAMAQEQAKTEAILASGLESRCHRCGGKGAAFPPFSHGNFIECGAALLV